MRAAPAAHRGAGTQIPPFVGMAGFADGGGTVCLEDVPSVNYIKVIKKFLDVIENSVKVK